MNNILLIVDPQYDFIHGSLAVNAADKAMQNLADYLHNNFHNFDKIYITTDQHPINHCSFKENGGLWPIHCVKYTQGAAINQDIILAIHNCVKNNIPYQVIEKGRNVDLEEYSAFKQLLPSDFFYAKNIFVAGIAGDYCVFESVQDLVTYGLAHKLILLNSCIASIDGGKKLTDYCQQENLQTI